MRRRARRGRRAAVAPELRAFLHRGFEQATQVGRQRPPVLDEVASG